MKKEYEKPEIEITVFETGDIMTASEVDNNGSWNEGWQQ